MNTTGWDLTRLRYEIRQVTGKYDTVQLPDQGPGVGNYTINTPSGIDDYINDYYLYDMPEDMRSLRLRNFYTFTTVPNCGTYSIPQNVLQLYGPIYVDNYQYSFYQDPDLFYRVWPDFNFIDAAISTTTANVGPYNFTLTQSPVQQGTVVIGVTPNQDGPPPTPSPALETFTDTDQPIPLDIPQQQYFVNPGILTGNQGGTGTIDYLTGAVSITFASNPPAGLNINAHYHPYVASRPRDIMVWQQQVFLRPIPNDVYSVKMMAYLLPTTVMNAATNATQRPSINVVGNNDINIQGFDGATSLQTDLPQFNEFWQLIVYGASLKIFAKDGEHEEYQRYLPYYEKSKLLCQRKTLKQLSQNRIHTAYDGSMNGQYQYGLPIFPYY